MDFYLFGDGFEFRCREDIIRVSFKSKPSIKIIYAFIWMVSGSNFEPLPGKGKQFHYRPGKALSVSGG
jgi:hypothetical protein